MNARPLATLAILLLPAGVFAQGGTPPADDPDRDVNVAQADFTVITMPTTLRVPKGRGSFRLTHRFTRSLGAGDFGDLSSDLFGLDNGAIIGLEFRYGLMNGLQAGLNRTSDKTIAFFGEYNLLQQRKDGAPIGLNVTAGVDGTNNFRDEYSPNLGVVASRELGSHGAIYVNPAYVHNTNLLPDVDGVDNDTVMVGLGARLRIRPTVYLVGEYVPRAGYTPGVNHASVGIEKRAGGHVFQLNVSNGFGTTPSQVARGGIENGDGSANWYLGFNLSRKFY